ncbi:hypothetical protein NUM3379_20340 [Kineococcus sp. NUM-3379]
MGAVATLVLAASAALLFAVADAVAHLHPGADAPFVILWLLGWTLLAWAVLVGGLVAVRLLHRLLAWRGPAWSEVLPLVAGAAVVVTVICTHPLWGSGSARG